MLTTFYFDNDVDLNCGLEVEIVSVFPCILLCNIYLQTGKKIMTSFASIFSVFYDMGRNLD